MLEFLTIDHLADEKAGNLSGGQKKLLELGRTMMTEAKIVFLDEVGAGVNRTLLATVGDAIERLNRERGYTFCMIEHDMDFIGRLCDPVIVMAEGHVLAEGTIDEIKANEAVIEAYLGTGSKHRDRKAPTKPEAGRPGPGGLGAGGDGVRALALAAIAVVFGVPSAADDGRCWPIEMADIQLRFCDDEKRWVDWFEGREPKASHLPLAYGWALEEREGDTVALLRPKTIAYESENAASVRYKHIDSDLQLVGPALGFGYPDLLERRDFPYRGWPVPATTTVFQFDGEADPTVFKTRARQDDSVVGVFTIVPRPLTPEEIDRHLAGNACRRPRRHRVPAARLVVVPRMTFLLGQST